MAITTNGVGGISADGVATLSNKTLDAPVINNATFTGAQAGLEIKFGNNIVFEGTTADAYETTLSAGDPTADRTITLPNATGTVVLVDTTDTLTNKTLTSPVISSISNTGTLTLPTSTDTLVGRDTTDTLTNKTLTSPVVSGLTLSDSSIVFEGSTADAYETTLTVTDPTADRTLTLPNATDTLVGRDTTDTLTNKTLTSPTINTAVTNYPTIKTPQEITTVSATAATGTINYDTKTQAVLYYTSNASANWTVNLRGDGSNSLDSLMDTGDSLTAVFLVTQGATAYYNSAVQIDGNAVTPKWQGGTAPAAGNASSIDIYSYTVIKTGSATFTVFASQTKFA